MAYVYMTLVVLTLLQLSRAEISDSSPDSDWYSANVINDGFHPKPISEIFSTEATFSSTNPIIVLPTSSSPLDDAGHVSTLAPPTSTPNAVYTKDFSELVSITGSTLPTPFLSSLSPHVPTQTDSHHTTVSDFLPPVQTIVSADPIPVEPISSQPIHTVSTPSPSPISIDVPVQPITKFNEQTQTSQNQSQQIRFEVVPQIQSATNQPNPRELQFAVTQASNSPTSVTPQSNYFLIYQQAPQNIQTFQQPPSVAPPITTTMPTTRAQTPTQVIITNPSTATPLPITRPTPTVTIHSVPSKLPISTTHRPVATKPNCRNTTKQTPKSTQMPPTVITNILPLKIRVVAPSGSITNVNINHPTTTTKRPTTTRTKKPKPRCNRYELCIDSCKGKKEPICAIPIATATIDPKALKGFPSVCHMACHNSFRKDTYEKLIDGRCGKLRTRIRPLDSKHKIKKPDLIKLEYTVHDDEPKTVVEFLGLDY